MNKFVKAFTIITLVISSAVSPVMAATTKTVGSLTYTEVKPGIYKTPEGNYVATDAQALKDFTAPSFADSNRYITAYGEGENIASFTDAKGFTALGSNLKEDAYAPNHRTGVSSGFDEYSMTGDKRNIIFTPNSTFAKAVKENGVPVFIQNQIVNKQTKVFKDAISQHVIATDPISSKFINNQIETIANRETMVLNIKSLDELPTAITLLNSKGDARFGVRGVLVAPENLPKNLEKDFEVVSANACVNDKGDGVGDFVYLVNNKGEAYNLDNFTFYDKTGKATVGFKNHTKFTKSNLKQIVIGFLANQKDPETGTNNVFAKTLNYVIININK